MRKHPARLVIATFVIGGILAGLAGAYACTAVATLTLSPKAARPGATVEGIGRSYSNSPTRPVQIHFNRLDGAVLETTLADARGNINFDFQAPKVKPGRYVIVATQYDETGKPVYGTPARTVLRIRR